MGKSYIKGKGKMGRLKLPEQAKRKLRQYYLTAEERVQMDAYLEKIRKKGLKTCGKES